MNEFYEENKKTIIFIVILIALITIFSIAPMFIGNGNKKFNPEDAIKELGRVYYEDVYYPQLKEMYPSDYEKILDNKSEDGIKMTLSSLMSSLKTVNINAFINEKDNTFCDIYETYVIIYPESSYDINDYSLKTNINCNNKVATEGE